MMFNKFLASICVHYQFLLLLTNCNRNYIVKQVRFLNDYEDDDEDDGDEEDDDEDEDDDDEDDDDDGEDDEDDDDDEDDCDEDDGTVCRLYFQATRRY